MSKLTKPPIRLIDTPPLTVIGSKVVYEDNRLVLKEVIEGEEAALIEDGKYDKNTGTLTLVMEGDRVLAIGGFPTIANMSKGSIGMRGATGSDGLNGINGDDGRVGDIGPRGVLGDQGKQGATGNTGATGLVGIVGATGPVGATGLDGAQGDSGIGGSFTCTENGGIEFNYTSGLVRQWGSHSSGNLTQAIEIPFHKAYEGDLERINLQLTFLDASSTQATTYRITEVNRGGFVIAVDELLPLKSNWNFNWESVGDSENKVGGAIPLPELPYESIPAASITRSYIEEPTEGTEGFMVFDVYLEEANTGEPITIDYVVEHVTTDDSDIGSKVGSLVINTGEIRGELKISVLGDNLEEPDEQFKVSLTNISRGYIEVDSALGTIKEAE